MCGNGANTESTKVGKTEEGLFLNEIYFEKKIGLRLYLDGNANLFWNLGTHAPEPLAAMPHKLQSLFLIKFIQGYELAERVRFINAPIKCIELYIKAKYLLSADLEIEG